MPDVERGEPFQPTAKEWNGFRAAARHAEAAERNGGGADFRSLPPGVVLVRNDGESDLPDRAVVGIGDVVVGPESAGDGAFRSAPPAFGAATPKKLGQPWGILLQPLKAGEIGRACVHGGVLAKITWEDDATTVGPAPSETYAHAGFGGAAILWANADDAEAGDLVWAFVLVGAVNSNAGDGDVIPCKVAGGGGEIETWAKGVPVTFYENGFTQDATGSGVVYLPEVGAETAPKPNMALLAHRYVSFLTGSSFDEEIEEEEEED